LLIQKKRLISKSEI